MSVDLEALVEALQEKAIYARLNTAMDAVETKCFTAFRNGAVWTNTDRRLEPHDWEALDIIRRHLAGDAARTEEGETVAIDKEDQAVIQKMWDLLIYARDPMELRRSISSEISGEELNRIQRMVGGE